MAFMYRFRSTCWSWSRLPGTASRRGRAASEARSRRAELVLEELEVSTASVLRSVDVFSAAPTCRRATSSRRWMMR
jgi:hypothetical protein